MTVAILSVGAKPVWEVYTSACRQHQYSRAGLFMRNRE